MRLTSRAAGTLKGISFLFIQVCIQFKCQISSKFCARLPVQSLYDTYYVTKKFYLLKSEKECVTLRRRKNRKQKKKKGGKKGAVLLNFFLPVRVEYQPPV